VRVCADLVLDAGAGVVGGVALDEDQLGLAAHVRHAREDVGDVARLVARRDDDGDLRLRRGARRRAGDEEVGQATQAERPQPGEEGVAQS
jgi:hypothetical protein